MSDDNLQVFMTRSNAVVCPICGGPLVHHILESVMIEILPEGYGKDAESETARKIFCSNCRLDWTKFIRINENLEYEYIKPKLRSKEEIKRDEDMAFNPFDIRYWNSIKNL